MDLFSLLHNDHERLRDLLRRLEDIPWEDRDRTLLLFNHLYEELSLHSWAETQVLYPRLAAFPETARLARECLREHAELDSILEKLRNLPCDDERWRLLFEVLKEELRVHIDDEEDRVFKKIHRLFREREWGEIAQELAAAKAKRPAA